ncbi:hypothetical protein EV702DRAFT_1132079 [Suillus placidus]|uniref:Uncharacterized protein n=1 Tax=Suillus placidus TaxID=48579 RepID=A0A9P7CYH0_9AGAM|nr:hypothetical protein EV702DRAFT_1132079 [Suillus placidus]
MSTEVYVRNLIFQSNNLGKESDLLLTFDGPMPGDHYPVVWRVSTFGKDGAYQMRATYRSQHAFTKPLVEGGIIVDAAAAVDINGARQQTTLTKADNRFKFSTPVEGTAAVINDAGEAVGLTLGFNAAGKSLPTPMLYFGDVRNGSKVTPQFYPRLRAYVTSGYREAEILRGEIAAPTLWDQNLAALDETTTWNLTWDTTGRYRITPA